MSYEVILPFLRPIQALLESPAISEIMINPDSSIWIEQDGCIECLPELSFADGALQTGLEVIANRFGKKLDPSSPIINLRLPDGSRMAAMIPPVVHPQAMMTIRKFTSRNFVPADLVRLDMLTTDQAIMLTATVRDGQNMLIAGGTGSGKTTLLNVLADAIPEHERILTIEDTAELHIRKPHLVAAESQTGTHRGQVTFDQLLRAMLRHRPDRILVGEVRGAEARTLLDAMNTGHRGTLATIHASSAEEALHRLATLAMRDSPGLTLASIENEVQRCIDAVVFVGRVAGRRSVQSILQLKH